MRYPEHLIEQVRRCSDIVEVVGDVVRLKKQGRSLVGLCPFHDDRNPSMHVNPELGLFKCFSCGKGGNVITFTMEFHRLTFQEAVKNLARRAHIALPDEAETTVQSETRSRREAAFRALEAAARIYTQYLFAPEGTNAARYFAKREFGAKIIEDFALGYAPNAWNIIGDNLRKQGFTDQTLDDAGLLVRREDGKSYDRFRGRAMFTIHDATGRVVGFGARIIQEADGQPKYINSPQSVTYDKSRILYGLFQAKQQIRSDGYAILVEGYADVLTLHQAGFRNAVASSGTALTKEQLQLLGRYCKQLFIVYDGDAAGAKATLRGLELSVEAGFDVRIVRLPANEDPDSFTRRSGADAFRGRLLSALAFLDFMIESLRESGGLDTPQARAESLRALVGMVARMPDTLQHDAQMLKIADALRLSSRELHRIYDELGKARHDAANRGEMHAPEPVPHNNNAGLHSEEIIKKTETAAEPDILPISNEESAVLRIAITVPKALRYLIEKVDLQPQSMLTERGKRLLAACRSALSVAEDDPLGWLLNAANLAAGDADAIAGLVMKRETPSDKWSDFDVEIEPEDVRRVMTDALLKMRLQKLEGELAEIKQLLRTPDAKINEIEVLTAVKRLTEERSRIAQSLGSTL